MDIPNDEEIDEGKPSTSKQSGIKFADWTLSDEEDNLEGSEQKKRSPLANPDSIRKLIDTAFKDDPSSMTWKTNQGVISLKTNRRRKCRQRHKSNAVKKLVLRNKPKGADKEYDEVINKVKLLEESVRGLTAEVHHMKNMLMLLSQQKLKPVEKIPRKPM